MQNPPRKSEVFLELCRKIIKWLMPVEITSISLGEEKEIDDDSH